MVIYFDETYDHGHEYLILAALFNPHSKYLHRRLLEAKADDCFMNDDGTTRELKYSQIKSRRSQRVAKAAIDIFMDSTSWFRCVVISQALVDLNRFGRPSEQEPIKKARMYKKFAELLIAHNTDHVYNAVLLVDELTRCKGDEFIEIMKQEFSVPFAKHSMNSASPTLKDVIELHSHLDQYHVNQINDLLAGCVLNNLIPTRNMLKNSVREYLVERLNVSDLLPTTWQRYSKTYVERYFPKFNIWYWQPS